MRGKVIKVLSVAFRDNSMSHHAQFLLFTRPTERRSAGFLLFEFLLFNTHAARH